MPLRSPVVPVDRPSGPPFDRQRGDRTRAGDRRRDGRSVPGLRSELAAGARVPLRPPHGDDREHRDESAQRRPRRLRPDRRRRFRRPFHLPLPVGRGHRSRSRPAIRRTRPRQQHLRGRRLPGAQRHRERVVFSPESGRLITLVDERTELVPLGTAVSVLGTEGTEVATVSVNDLIDPFQDYDPSSAPERGSRYVVVEVTVTNTGTRPLSVAPYDFYLVDTERFLANSTYLFRSDATNPPDFQGVTSRPTL